MKGVMEVVWRGSVKNGGSSESYSTYKNYPPYILRTTVKRTPQPPENGQSDPLQVTVCAFLDSSKILKFKKTERFDWPSFSLKRVQVHVMSPAPHRSRDALARLRDSHWKELQYEKSCHDMTWRLYAISYPALKTGALSLFTAQCIT